MSRAFDYDVLHVPVNLLSTMSLAQMKSLRWMKSPHSGWLSDAAKPDQSRRKATCGKSRGTMSPVVGVDC